MMRGRLLGVAALAAFAGLGPATARASDSCRRRSDTLGWYVPDRAKLQTGGELGLFTLGAGYAAWDVLGVDLYYGWVPEAVGGIDIHSVALRIDGRVESLCLSRSLGWRYIGGGIGALMTFGERFFLVPPSGYERDYRQTAMRGFLTLGTALELRGPDTSVLASTTAFLEVTALDTYALDWLKNTRTLSFWDIWSLSLGVQVGF